MVPEENTSISAALEDCESTTTWGWGDECISDEFKKMTSIVKPLSRPEINLAGAIGSIGAFGAERER